MSEDSFSLPSWKAFLVGFGSGLLTTAVGVVAVRQVIQILANRENGDRTDSGIVCTIQIQVSLVFV